VSNRSCTGNGDEQEPKRRWSEEHIGLAKGRNWRIGSKPYIRLKFRSSSRDLQHLNYHGRLKETLTITVNTREVRPCSPYAQGPRLTTNEQTINETYLITTRCLDPTIPFRKENDPLGHWSETFNTKIPGYRCLGPSSAS
jgi:hypothetical protein